ncbi:hypothetical protein D3C86_1810620 [compost metagenome]
MARAIFLLATGSICPSRPILMLPESVRLMCCTSTLKPSAAASKRRAASTNWVPLGVTENPARPRSHKRKPRRASSDASCALMVGWVVLSVVCAAEMPPASTTARNTRIRRRSSSVTLPSISCSDVTVT